MGPVGRFASAETATSLALMTELAGWVADAFEARVRDHEERWLSPLAVRSYETRGRAREEEPCRLRTPFQRDRDRIVHSKAFRRLRNKTQVFIDPGGDHFRTRITHTVETTGISRGVALRAPSRRPTPLGRSTVDMVVRRAMDAPKWIGVSRSGRSPTMRTTVPLGRADHPRRWRAEPGATGE